MAKKEAVRQKLGEAEAIRERLGVAEKKLHALGWLEIDFMHPRPPYEAAGEFPVAVPDNATMPWDEDLLIESATYKSQGHTAKAFYPIDTIREGRNDTRLLVSSHAVKCLLAYPDFPAIVIQKRDATGNWGSTQAIPFLEFEKRLKNGGGLPKQSDELLAFINLANAAELPLLNMSGLISKTGERRCLVDAHRITMRGMPPIDRKKPTNEWCITADFQHPDYLHPVFHIYGSGLLIMAGAGRGLLVSMVEGKAPSALCPRPLSDLLDPNTQAEILQAMREYAGGLHRELARFNEPGRGKSKSGRPNPPKEPK